MRGVCIGNSNGDLDPWSAGGVLESPSPSLMSIVIKDAAHHLDLRASNAGDTADVVAARRLEKAAVKRWLRQYWHQTHSTTAKACSLMITYCTVSMATTCLTVCCLAPVQSISLFLV